MRIFTRSFRTSRILDELSDGLLLVKTSLRRIIDNTTTSRSASSSWNWNTVLTSLSTAA